MPYVGDFHPPAYRHITAFDALPLRRLAPQGAEPTDADIDARNAEFRARQMREGRRVAAALTHVDEPQISDAKARRTAKVMLDYCVSSQSLLDVRADLNRPFVPGIASNIAVSDDERRLYLAAMLRISSNLAHHECLELIDHARAMPSDKVSEFIFREVMILSRGATAASGTSFVASASLAGASAKLAALKVGAVPVMHLLGGAAVCAGLTACGVTMMIVGASSVRHMYDQSWFNVLDNWAVFEKTWRKDRRIMECISQGRAVGNNPCPINERPHV